MKAERSVFDKMGGIFRLSLGHRFRALRLSRHEFTGLYFSLPAVVYLAIFSILPIGFSIYLAFTADVPDQRVDRVFSGIKNFEEVITNERFHDAAIQTFEFASLSTILHVTLGLGIALLFNQALDRRFLSIARSFFLLPWAVSPVVVGIIFRLVYSSQFSFISILLGEIKSGLVWQPLSSTKTALIAVILANVWHFTPYFSINILAGLQGISQALYEAAKVDGASTFQSFRHITLPSVKRLLLTIAFFDFVVSSIYFDLIWILTQGGPVWASEVIVTHIYRKAFQQYSMGYAAAAGLLLFVLLMILTAVVVREMEKE
jgi:multiple sugar transport system permease protein